MNKKWYFLLTIEIFRITFTVNGRNDHVTTFTSHLPLAVFNFSEKLCSFALASKAGIILPYSHLLIFSTKHKREFCRKRDSRCTIEL